MSGKTERDRLLNGCDEAQIAAITSEGAPLLVLAGAGSGKTRVLTRRIAWRIAEESATPGHCLALTFTRKAAGELRQRLAALGLEAPVFAGTFHAVALAQLRQRAIDRGKPIPSLLDSKARLVGPILADIGLRERRGRPIERRELVAALAGEIEWAKARLISPDRYVQAAQQAGRSIELDAQVVAETFEQYEREKTKRRALDFEDLLSHLTAEIANDGAFAASQRWRFRHLFVDELQDANGAQLALLEAWLGTSTDLFAVGDPRQAIYGWNGADPGAIATFAERFKGATVLGLDANYRSTPQVVAVASAVLGLREQQRAPAPRPDGPVPTLVAYASDDKEAQGVANELRSAHRRGRQWSQCAVLARTNAQLTVLERALEAAQIPCRTSGEGALFARSIVQDALRQLDRSPGTAAFCAWLDDVELDASLARQRGSDRPEGEEAAETADQLGDLEALVLLGRDYLLYDPAPSSNGFMSFARQSLRSEPVPGRHNGVELLTFHRAKGLEWPVVFIVGLEDGFVPIARARSSEALEEEERLLYVALSRAEDELHCSWARSRAFPTRTVTREPSPYLEAIDLVRSGLKGPAIADAEQARRAIAASRAALSTPAS